MPSYSWERQKSGRLSSFLPTGNIKDGLAPNSLGSIPILTRSLCPLPPKAYPKIHCIMISNEQTCSESQWGSSLTSELGSSFLNPLCLLLLLNHGLFFAAYDCACSSAHLHSNKKELPLDLIRRSNQFSSGNWSPGSTFSCFCNHSQKIKQAQKIYAITLLSSPFLWIFFYVNLRTKSSWYRFAFTVSY